MYDERSFNKLQQKVWSIICLNSITTCQRYLTEHGTLGCTMHTRHQTCAQWGERLLPAAAAYSLLVLQFHFRYDCFTFYVRHALAVASTASMFISDKLKINWKNGKTLQHQCTQIIGWSLLRTVTILHVRQCQTWCVGSGTGTKYSTGDYVCGGGCGQF